MNSRNSGAVINRRWSHYLLLSRCQSLLLEEVVPIGRTSSDSSFWRWWRLSIRFEKRLNAELEQHYQNMDQYPISIQVVVFKMISRTLYKNNGLLWPREQQMKHHPSRIINDTFAKVGLGHVRVSWKLSYVPLRPERCSLYVSFLIAINIRRCSQLLKVPSVRTWNVLWLQHSCSDGRVFF